MLKRFASGSKNLKNLEFAGPEHTSYRGQYGSHLYRQYFGMGSARIRNYLASRIRIFLFFTPNYEISFIFNTVLKREQIQHDTHAIVEEFKMLKISNHLCIHINQNL